MVRGYPGPGASGANITATTVVFAGEAYQVDVGPPAPRPAPTRPATGLKFNRRPSRAMADTTSDSPRVRDGHTRLVPSLSCVVTRTWWGADA